MIKYKNIFLAVICVIAGLSVCISNLYNHTNVLEKSIKNINSNYIIKKTSYVNLNSDFSIRSSEFSISKTLSINNIAIASEESTYGFKNMYKLASVPGKLKKINKKIKNIKQNIKNEVIERNESIANLSSFVSNEQFINYHNDTTSKEGDLFASSNLTYLVTANNLKKSSMFGKKESTRSSNGTNIWKKAKKWVIANKTYSVLGFAGAGILIFVASGTAIVVSLYLIKKIKSRIATEQNHDRTGSIQHNNDTSTTLSSSQIKTPVTRRANNIQDVIDDEDIGTSELAKKDDVLNNEIDTEAIVTHPTISTTDDESLDYTQQRISCLNLMDNVSKLTKSSPAQRKESILTSNNDTPPSTNQERENDIEWTEAANNAGEEHLNTNNDTFNSHTNNNWERDVPDNSSPYFSMFGRPEQHNIESKQRENTPDINHLDNTNNNGQSLEQKVRKYQSFESFIEQCDQERNGTEVQVLLKPTNEERIIDQTKEFLSVYAKEELAIGRIGVAAVIEETEESVFGC